MNNNCALLLVDLETISYISGSPFFPKSLSSPGVVRMETGLPKPLQGQGGSLLVRQGGMWALLGLAAREDLSGPRP